MDVFQERRPGGSDGKEFARNAGDPGSILGLEDPLEKEMVTHTSIPAWEIPWAEEPGRLQSTGSPKSWTRLSDYTTTSGADEPVEKPSE